VLLPCLFQKLGAQETANNIASKHHFLLARTQVLNLLEIRVSGSDLPGKSCASKWDSTTPCE
jgi:hypothetical protein